MTEITIQRKRRILIIDSHPLFREGFKTILNRDARFEIVGETGNGREGFRMVKTLRPDLVVMEILLPDQDAIQLIRHIRSLFPKTAVMILSIYSGRDNISQAFQAGAAGYAVKEINSNTLFKGFEAVLKGDRFLFSSVSLDSDREQVESSRLNKMKADPHSVGLTPRELEIMRLVAEGVPRKEIAKRLYISPKTVENHASKIMKKLSVKNIFEVVRCAARLGLIDVDLWKREPVPDRLLVQQM